MKTFVYIGASLDGFIARKNNDIDWLVEFQSPEIHQSYNEFISGIDVILIGRGTYEKVLTFSHWPYEKKVFVLSNSLKTLPDNLNEKAVILSMNPPELRKYLGAEGYSNIYVDGGKVIQDFLVNDCIDEMIITRVPVLIGTGISLFSYLDHDLRFDHIQTHVYSNGLVKSHYARRKK